VKVFKYIVPIQHELVEFLVPDRAKVLSVGMQGHTPVVWALVDQSRPAVTLRLRWFGTGWDVPADIGEFVGTVQCPNGLVFHLFHAEA